MARPYYFTSSYSVANNAGEFYEMSRGTEQPILSHYNSVYTLGNGFGNDLPFYNSNNWEFGLSEASVYDRWMDLVEGAGAAVSAGGALTFYELNFKTTGVNAMNFNLRASGSNTPTVTVENSFSTGVKVGDTEGMITNPTGTNLLAWGSNEHGTLPIDNSKYDSGLLKFTFRPEWVDATAYAVDALVKVTPSTGTAAPSHYVCILAHTSDSGNDKPGSGTNEASYWTQIDMADTTWGFGSTIQYSPWTDDKARLWSNAGADPSRGNGYTNGGWFDINVVINEEEWFRTWVDCVATSNATLDTHAATYAYDATRATFPRGFRVLVNVINPSGDLAGFPNMVVERVQTGTGRGVATSWRKLYNFDTANTKVQVANLDEAKIYADTITGSAGSPSHSWASIETGKYGNDCFHPYTSAPSQVSGIDLVYDSGQADYVPRQSVTDSTERPDITKAGGTFALNINSAVRLVSLAPDIASSTAADYNTQTSGWYKTVVGLNFRFPWPNNNAGISENVGELYGGGASNDVNSTTGLGPIWVTSYVYTKGDNVYQDNNLYICLIDHTSGTFATDLAALKWRLLLGKEPATLDIQNMNLTHDGQQGFNTINESCQDLGQISALAFWLKFSITSGGVELNDEHRFRAWLIDTKDNVVYQDFVVRFSNHWEDIRLPVGSFRIYKGRKPLYGFEVVKASFVPPKELEIINIFEWRNIKLGGIQYQPMYDEFGRFNPAAALVNESGNSVTWSTLTGATRSLEMDGFRWIKPLLASSGSVTDRNLEPDFLQLPNITVYDQLVNAAKSQLEIEKFKHKEFNIESSGDEIFDIPFGESFYLKNTDIVSDSDNSVVGNIQLVNKRAEFSITKPQGGKGGLRRKIKGVKIFT